MKREIFSTFKLNNNDEITLFQLKGIDWFNALLKCNNQSQAIAFFILCEIGEVNDSKITMEYLYELDGQDVMILMEVINAQMLKVK